MRAPCRFSAWAFALAPLLVEVPSSPPPISSQLPDEQEQIRAQQEVVPPAVSEADSDRASLPKIYEGTLIEVDRQSRALWVATEDGPQHIRLSRDAAVNVNGKPIKDLSQLPQGQDVRASYRATDDAETLDLNVVHLNGPQVRPPRDQDSPSVSP